MIRRLLQCFFVAALVLPVVGQANSLDPEQSYQFAFTDVDGNQLSLHDGHVTLVTVIVKQDHGKADTVGDRVPEKYLGDPHYRLITVVNFQKSVSPFLQGVTSAIMRHRLDLEAARIQARYSAKQSERDPRSDLFAVADFDGKAISKLGMQPDSDEFAVFLFNGEGKLVRHWHEIPPADELSAALQEASG